MSQQATHRCTCINCCRDIYVGEVIMNVDGFVAHLDCEEDGTE